ncbi:MAG: hypothetical protein K6A45_03260 [Lachnospiraceae bacterium]|nr:hypothetical protein [Lachnospiraceae bacterium]
MGILSLILGGCAGVSGSNGKGSKAKPNESGITSLYYGYHGSRAGYSYTVSSKDGKTVFEFDDSEHRDYGVMEYECDASAIEQLEKLYLDHKVYEWDGFSKTNKDVLDGDGFSLTITFNDGSEMNAHGSNASPKGFWEYEEELTEVIAPVKKACLDKYRADVIAKGINGNLDSVFVYFKQQGTSGRDSYTFHVFDKSIRDNNLDIQYTSRSGEYFPEGEEHYMLTVSLKDIGLEKVRKMIDDYGMLDWYDYDETAEDYNNSEWFQVSFGFDDGLSISACGTKHPEHYDEFRSAFLAWMQDVVTRFCK